MYLLLYVYSTWWWCFRKTAYQNKIVSVAESYRGRRWNNALIKVHEKHIQYDSFKFRFEYVK